jgi:Uma2 family endonuclease
MPTLDRRFSREEYRAWCEQQPRGRFERVDGRIVAMAPQRAAHARVKGVVYRALVHAVAVAGIPCEAFPDGMTVESGDSDYEPDSLINCGKTMDPNAVAVPDPVVVVEVLSPSAASTDTGGKLIDYFRVPSIAHYLIVHPIHRTVIHHRRDGERIDTRLVAAGPIAMDPPGIVITVEEIFENAPASPEQPE